MTASADAPVFIVGVHRRCGSNFLGDALKLCPTLSAPQPLYEDYVLEHSPLLAEYVERTASKQYRKRFKDEAQYGECKAAMLKRLGDGILAFLADRIAPSRRLLTKTPDPFHLENFFLLFPGAMLLLLVRDGRDVVESAHRSWPDEPCWQWIRAWAAGARTILDFAHGPGEAWRSQWRLVRYEDLLAGRPALEAVLEFIGVRAEDYPWEKLEQLPLRGSSVHRGGKEELNWSPIERPKDFRPVGRWESWGWWQRRQFKRWAGRELIELEYVADNTW